MGGDFEGTFFFTEVALFALLVVEGVLGRRRGGGGRWGGAGVGWGGLGSCFVWGFWFGFFFRRGVFSWNVVSPTF